MIYLHIGTHKTGTTAIQQALRKSEKLLAAKNLAFIETPSKLQQLQFTKKPLAGKDWAQFYQEVQKANNGKDLIVSYEGFSGDILAGYLNAPSIAKSLERIFEYQKVRVIVYYREQVEFIEECYAQQIHQGGSLSIDDFLARLDEKSFDWLWHARQFSKLFGRENMSVIWYGGNSTTRFSEIIGCDLRQAVNQPNRTFNKTAIEIARLCNPRLNKEERTRLRNIMQSRLSLMPTERLGMISEGSAIVSRYTDNNHRLKEEYCALYIRS